MQTSELLTRWARAWPETAVNGTLKSCPEDFVVNELAQHTEQENPAGDHLYLYLQKRNQTTRELVREVADANGLPISSIGYAGMKDKVAVTTQWVSIPIGEGEGTGTTDVAVPDAAQELKRVRQSKKLRRGWHAGNAFELRLRGMPATHRETLESRLAALAAEGAPNYFAEQRFGSDNLTQAIAWLPRRRRERNAFRRGLHLSVLRSFLFNEVLSARIADGSWATPLAGEDEPAGPLWGRGRVQASEAVRVLEQAALCDHMDIAGELEFAGLSQERRALRLRPENFSWEFSTAAEPAMLDLHLEFTLPPGTYATALLRELGNFSAPVKSA